MTTLVLGFGNAWRGDDAAGLEVARLLRTTAPAGTRVVQYEGEPLGLISAWDAEDEVILIDAVSSGARPGTVHRLDLLAGPLPAHLSRRSTHHLGVADAVELARALDGLPARLELYGIEARAFEAGAELAPDVQRAVELVAREVEARLRENY